MTGKEAVKLSGRVEASTSRSTIATIRSKRMHEASAKFVYVILRDAGTCKIGISKNPKRRRRSLQDSTSDRLKLVFIKKTKKDAFWVEQAVLRIFYFLKIRGEWLNCRHEFATDIIQSIDSDDPEIMDFADHLKHSILSGSLESKRLLWARWPERALKYEGRRFGQRILGLLRHPA